MRFLRSLFNSSISGIAPSTIAGLSLYLGIPFAHQPELGNLDKTIFIYLVAITSIINGHQSVACPKVSKLLRSLNASSISLLVNKPISTKRGK